MEIYKTKSNKQEKKQAGTLGWCNIYNLRGAYDVYMGEMR